MGGPEANLKLDAKTLSIPQLLDIFKLNNPTIDDVNVKVESALKANEGNEEVKKFINEAGAKLLKHLGNIDTQQSIQDVVTQYASADSNDDNMVVVQGATNPNLSSSTTKKVLIDSRRRRHLFPVLENLPNYFTSPSNFYMNLDSPLRNVLSYQLGNVDIPFTYNAFEFSDSNTFMWVTRTDDGSLNEIPRSQYKVLVIPNGNYSGQQIVDELNTRLQNLFLDASGNTTANDIKFNYLPNRDMLSITNSSANMAYRFLFFDSFYQMPRAEPLKDNTDDEEEDDVANCNPATMIDRNLGYFLGFRLKKLLRPIHGDPVNGPGGAIYRNVPAGKTIVADTQCDLRPAAYMLLVLDDGNHNYANVPLELATESLGDPPPSRLAQIREAAQDLLDCETPDLPGNVLFKKRTGRTPNFFVQAYNARVDADAYDTSHLRTPPPVVRNTFAKLTFDYSGAVTGQNLTFTGGDNATKQFYAPISIHRFNVRLVNPLGNTVNLHGHNWSFDLTLTVQTSNQNDSSSDLGS